MDTKQRKDVNIAIADVNIAIAKLDKKISEIQERTSQLKLRRRQQLMDYVVSVLPDLTHSRIEMLERSLPSFFTPDVEEVFAQPKGLKRLIGIFVETRDKAADLKFLQVKLLSLIDSLSINELQKLRLDVQVDVEAVQAIVNTATLLNKHYPIEEMVQARTVLRAQLKKLIELRDGISAVRGVAKPVKTSQKTAPARKTPQVVETRTIYRDRDVDHLMSDLFWVNMFLGDHHRHEPTFQGGGGTFSGAGASGGWDASPSLARQAASPEVASIIAAVADEGYTGTHQATDHRAADSYGSTGDTGIPTQSLYESTGDTGISTQSIATDDSLGRFS